MRIHRSLLVTAAACAFLPSVLAAQSKRPSVGILLGTNIATISDADQGIADVSGANFKKKHRIGLNVGAFVKIPLSSMLSLQPELHYAQNGVKIEGNSGTIDNIDLALDYIEVPVLLRLDLGNSNSSIHPLLLAGGSYASRVRCKLTASAGSSSLSQNCDADNGSTDPFKKSDYGVVGGAGLEMKSGGHSISLQVRYTYGLQDIAKTETPTTKPKNSAIGILLGFGL
ncbi:MAG: porin family protein [Gemmatimonadaceae bacterium]